MACKFLEFLNSPTLYLKQIQSLYKYPHFWKKIFLSLHQKLENSTTVTLSIVYTINGRLLQTQTVLHRTTSLLILDHEHILHGDENGELTVRDLYDGEIIHSVPLQMPIQGACLVARNTHLLVPLRDGKLIVVGSKIKH